MTRFRHKLNYVLNIFEKRTPELQLNNAVSSDIEAVPFLDVYLSLALICNNIIANAYIRNAKNCLYVQLLLEFFSPYLESLH